MPLRSVSQAFEREDKELFEKRCLREWGMEKGAFGDERGIEVPAVEAGGGITTTGLS